MKRLMLLCLSLCCIQAAAAAVRGSLMTQEGKPVSSVEVVAVSPQTTLQMISGETPRTLGTAKTSDKGEFSLEAGKGLAVLRVRADGYAPLDTIVEADSEAGAIVLQPAAAVTGHVRAAGKPVAGARVIAGNGRTYVVVTTDAAGAYRLPDPAAWAETLVAIHPDFAPAIHPTSVAEFTLDRGRILKGVVLDASGSAVKGAAVDIDFLQTATTAADGSFSFAHVGQRSSRIRATAPGGVAVAALSKGEMKLRLEPAVRVRGSVRDEQRKPVAGVHMRMGAGTGETDETVTGSDGSFDFPAASSGPFMLLADAGSVFEFQPIEVEEKHGDITREIAGKRSPVISVSISDAEGKSVAGAAIIVTMRVPQGMEFSRPTGVLTGADGTARIPLELDPSFTTTIAAFRPNEPLAVSSPVTSAREVKLVMPKGQPVTGIVKAADGKALAGVDVSPMLNVMPTPFAPHSPMNIRWAQTDEKGRFSGRVAGSMSMQFALKSFLPSSRRIDAGSTSPIEVVLTPAVTVSGHVVDDAGAPVPEIVVMAETNATFSDASGSFTIEGLAKGPVTLRYGRRMTEKTVDAPSRDLKLVVPRLRTISGKVTDAKSGAPVTSFTIDTSIQSSVTDRQPSTSDDGTFSIEVEPGAKLGVAATGYVPARDIPTTGPTVNVQLSRGRTARGRIVDEQNVPLSAVSISLGERDYDETKDVPQSGADGTYELSGLASDASASVTFFKEGFLKVERPVPAGTGDVTFDVVLKRGVVFSGRVVHASGAAAAGVSVTASSAAHGASYESADSDENGAFRFTSLAPGRYEFRVNRTSDGEQAIVKDVDIEKQHEITLKLQKSATATIVGKVIGTDTSGGPVMVMASESEGEVQSAAADAAGNFRIENAPTGSVEVVAGAMSMSGMRRSKKEVVDVAAGTEVHVDLRFPRRVKVEGSVVRGGTPLQGATVRLSGENDGNAKSDQSGRYTLTADEGEYEIEVFNENRQLPYSRKIFLMSDQTVDIALDDTSILATAMDAESGQPLAGVSVSLSKHGLTHNFANGKTAADGTVVLDAFGGEPLTVIAEKFGYANTSVEAVAGAAHTPVILRLTKASPTLVRVVDQRDGRTLSGYVIARDRSGRVIASSYETAGDGTSPLALGAGDYLISASAEGYGSHTMSARLPIDGEVKVPLPPGGNLTIKALNGLRGSARLLQPNGEEYVRCWCNGVATIDIEGPVTTVDRISPGSYTLELTPKSDKPRRMPVTILEGRTVSVTVE